MVLVDIVEGLPKGKALDILESGPILGYDSNVIGANDYEQTAGSDVVVITSGSPRKPGMSRDDLLKTNQNIVQSVTEEVVKHSPDTILVMVANPLDAMCHVAMETSGFLANGGRMAGILPGPLPTVIARNSASRDAKSSRSSSAATGTPWCRCRAWPGRGVAITESCRGKGEA